MGLCVDLVPSDIWASLLPFYNMDWRTSSVRDRSFQQQHQLRGPWLLYMHSVLSDGILNIEQMAAFLHTSSLLAGRCVCSSLTYSPEWSRGSTSWCKSVGDLRKTTAKFHFFFFFFTVIKKFCNGVWGDKMCAGQQDKYFTNELLLISDFLKCIQQTKRRF